MKDMTLTVVPSETVPLEGQIEEFTKTPTYGRTVERPDDVPHPDSAGVAE